MVKNNKFYHISVNEEHSSIGHMSSEKVLLELRVIKTNIAGSEVGDTDRCTKELVSSQVVEIGEKVIVLSYFGERGTPA